jgi:hypothetical protein
MSQVKNLLGHVFGRLTVVARAGSSPAGAALWECRCECGNTVVVNGHLLRDRPSRQGTKSCGCLHREAVAAINWKHGLQRDNKPEYNTWHGMLRRCYDPNHRAYPYYGGRGIKVCDAWRNSFPQFLADMGKRPEGMTIERENNHGDYEPGNCIWATWVDQNCNRRPYSPRKKKAA